MPRAATGSVRTKLLKSGPTAFYLRHQDADGVRVEYKIGETPEWNPDRADAELKLQIQLVKRGEWRDPRATSAVIAERSEDPLFDVFVSDWYEKKHREWTPETQENYLWRLQSWLIPYFGSTPVSKIDAMMVDDFKHHCLLRGVSKRVYNDKLLQTLRRLLESARDYAIIEKNPARSTERRATIQPGEAPNKPALQFDQLRALLEAAQDLDAGSVRYPHTGRAAFLACHFLGGMRVSEVCSLTWEHTNLRTGHIYVAEGKTKASIRKIPMVEWLWNLLSDHRQPNARHADLVFPTANGTLRDKDNARKQMFIPVLARSAALLNAVRDDHSQEWADVRTQPVGLSLRAGRRTAISWWLSAGVQPKTVMKWVGHTTANLTLEIYAQDIEVDPRVVKAMAGFKPPAAEPPA